jgi:hypothetical protein
MMLWKRGKSLAPGGNKTKFSALAILFTNIWNTAFTYVIEQKQETNTRESLAGTNQCSYFYLMMEVELAPETPFFTQHMCKTPSRTFRLGFPVIYTQHSATVITLRLPQQSAQTTFTHKSDEKDQPLTVPFATRQ